MKKSIKSKIGVIVTAILLVVSGSINAQTCTMTIDSLNPYITASGYSTIKPGDTVCLKAGTWDYLILKDFHGTASQPITFVNTGGPVVIKAITKPTNYIGIKFNNCSHIIFRGNGVPNIQYGFQVDTVAAGAGMSVDNLSTNVEVSHVEISHTYIGGVYAKTDPNCQDFSSTRDKFTLRNFYFHDNYVHDVPNEGLYIGNSHYSGFYLSKCDTTVYPQVLRGVKIYNNIIEHTGYDGIQVSSADSNCQIYGNRISSDSYQDVLYQMSGILIGGGSKCDTYNNMILSGDGDGIDVFGLGDYKIFNNLIVNAGKNYYPGDPTQQKHGIYVGTDSTLANAQLGIYNNTIISPKSFGIDLNNSKLAKILVINNLIADPGKYATDGSSSYINIANGISSNITEETNYKNDTISQIKFIYPDTANYDLQASSPAVDIGTDLTTEGITFDILNRTRPANHFDAGAYQHEASQGIFNQKASDVQSVKVYPNPASQFFKFEIKLKTTQQVNIVLSNVMGMKLGVIKTSCQAMQTCKQEFDIGFLTNGWYFLNIFTKSGKTSVPIIVQH